MRKRTNAGVGSRIFAAALLAAMLPSLFAGCGGRNAGETETVGEGKDTRETTEAEKGIWGEARELTGKEAVFPIEEDDRGFALERKTVNGVGSYVSLARDGDGYLLFAYTDAGYESIRLDREFQVISREPVNEEESWICAWLDPGKSGEKAYTVERREVGAASGVDDTRPFVCRDGEIIASAAGYTGEFTDIRLLSTEDCLWAINYHFLFCDGKQAKLPGLDPGYEWQGRGYATFGGKNYAVMCAANEGRNKEEWYLMELRGKGIGEVLKTNMRGYIFLAGDGAASNIFLADGKIRYADGEKIYDTGDLTRLGLGSDWLKSGWREEERIVLLSENNGIVILTESGEAPDDTGEIVIGAVAGPEFIPRDAVARFNQEKRGVVSVKIYQNEEKLNLALLSKEVDLVWGSDPEILFDRAKAGALEPIGDYMDLSAVYPNLVSLGSRDGKCWFLPADFSLMGAVLPESAAGERRYFTGMDDFDEALSALPAEVYQQATKSDILFRIDPMEWVNPESNTCDFQNANFLKLLEIAGRFADNRETVEAFFKNHNYAMFLNVSASLQKYSEDGYSPDNLEFYFDDYVRLYPDGGVSARAKLLPVPGNGRFRGLAVFSNNLVAVAAGNDRKEEIKAFLAFLFSGETERELGSKDYAQFCANRKTGEALMADALNMDKDLERAGEGATINPRITREDYARWKKGLSETIASADHWFTFSDSEYKKVMDEEVSRYFAGEISAEKAAEYIQNRISLMLAEKG